MHLRHKLNAALIGGVAIALATTSAAAAAPQEMVSIGDSTRIEGEDFQPGSGGFSDTTSVNLGGAYRTSGVDITSGGSGYYVGWTAAGEWLQYGLDVQRSGSYTATFRLASNQSTARTFHVEVDGRDVSGTVRHTGTTWNEWATVTANLAWIAAGEHTMRVVFDSDKLDVDYVTLQRATAAETPATGSYPGQPARGDVLWGAFYRPGSGSDDLGARYEIPAGHPLEISRSFFSWSERTSTMISEASADLAAGRLPWVSIKPPSWAAMAAGRHNADIDQMLRALDVLDGPVWLTVHHEPDGGIGINVPDDPAGPAGHLAMNQMIRQRMTALGVDNIALAPILMEYAFNPESGRDPDAYWAPGVYDFLGIDTYSHTGGSLLDQHWQTVRTWAAARGVDVAVGEFGINATGTTGAEVMRDFYQAALASGSDGAGARVVGLTVFDSAPKGWLLVDDQLAEYLRILSIQ
jgi:Carbohydrate binding module (family 6)